MSAFLKAFLLLSCTFLGLICGTLYLYSSYSPQFANRLEYSATDSSRIALLGTIGVAVAGPVAGRLVDKRGYTVSLIIGGAFVILGYFGMKKQYDSKHSSVHLSALLIFLIGCGSTFMNSACLKCCAVSFPSIRGVATSLPLALYGLSALFYSVIAALFFPGNTSDFLGFLSYSSAIIFVICTPSIIKYDMERGRRRARIAGTIQEIELSTITSNPVAHHKPNLHKDIGSVAAGTDDGAVAGSSSFGFDLGLEDDGGEVGGIDLIYNKKFWIIFFITGSLASLGQMYIYSVGYVVKALVSFGHISALMESDPEFQTKIGTLIQQNQLFQVGLLSVANCVGRIASGILGDIISQRNKPRSWLLFIPLLGLLLTQIMGYTFQDYKNLTLLSLLIGFFYGFTFCIMPLIVGDTFGMENYSLNWGFVGLAPILPSFYFTNLFGETYDSNSVRIEATGSQSCTLGRECYGSVFYLTIWVTVVSTIAVVALNMKKRKTVIERPLN